MNSNKDLNNNQIYTALFKKGAYLMEMYTTIVYVISDEILKALEIKDDPQSQMSNAEVITFSIVTAKFFQGNHKFSRCLCKKLGLFPSILSNSRLNRRIHKISWSTWEAIFRFLSLMFKQEMDKQEYIVFLFFVVRKTESINAKFSLKKKYIGYVASKKCYFCGIKVHMVVTCKGQPIEVHFKPGSESDLSVLWKMELDIPLYSTLYTEGAYNCFDLEDILQEESIILLAKRGKTAKKRLRTREEKKEISSKRQIIETTFSRITDHFPRNLRACTEQGFLIKVFTIIIAFNLSFLNKTSLSYNFLE